MKGSTRERGTWRRKIGLGAIVIMFGLGIVWGGDRAARAEAPDVKLDCSVYETKTTDFGVAFKVAHFLFNAGPEFSFSRKTGVAWDKVVHGTIARYVELCTRYNAGLVSKAEYETRMKEVEGLYKETKEIEAKLNAAVRQRAKEASDELDEALGRSRRAPSIINKASLEASVEGLANRIEHLEPISQPLKPSKPCPPPDMLGSPGVLQDPSHKC